MTADPATNSLVISAAPQDYETLRNIIEQLDVPRRQVFVQAVILEVSTTHERDLGINFSSGTNLSGSTIGAGAAQFRPASEHDQQSTGEYRSESRA